MRCRFLTKVLLVISLCVILLLAWHTYVEMQSSDLGTLTFVNEQQQDELESEISFQKPPATQPFDAKNRYVILMWKHPWNVESEGIEEGTIVGDCIFTYDRRTLADAITVVFHYTAFDHENLQPWPHYRHQDQLFVWFGLENPWHVGYGEQHNIDYYSEDFFNLTMSYRMDSDVFYPHVRSRHVEMAVTTGKDFVDAIILSKKKMAFWVASNCSSPTEDSKMQLQYVEKLIEAGLPVDLFGDYSGNGNEYDRLLQHPELGSYKFYFYFENSRYCRDYLSEKFWYYSLMSARVPVVWGPDKKEVAALAPPGSFIHVDDFATPSSLVSYLMYLNKNHAAYRQYFKWIESDNPFATHFYNLYSNIREERLCEKSLSNRKHKTISITRFFHGSERPECVPPPEMPPP